MFILEYTYDRRTICYAKSKRRRSRYDPKSRRIGHYMILRVDAEGQCMILGEPFDALCPVGQSGFLDAIRLDVEG